MGDHSFGVDQSNVHDDEHEISLDRGAGEPELSTTDLPAQTATGNNQQHTLSTKAVDELFVLITTFCNVIETFFQPFYPIEVTYDLHSDFMLLSQHLLFKRQEDGRVYEIVTILMRVDSQLDDKDMREKMRLM